MSGGNRRSAHLVERAVAAMGGSHLLTRAVAAPAGRGAPDPLPMPPPPPAASAAARPLRLPTASGALISLQSLRSAGLPFQLGNARSRINEEISVLQHQVLRTLRSSEAAPDRARVVLVTSTRPHEGKTFVALNLSAGLASSGGHPVVLVDTDGKKGSLSALLGLADRPGLRDLMADPAVSPGDVTVPTAIAGLAVVPRGGDGSRPQGTPASAALSAAIQRIAAGWPDHVVVLDTAPCLSTSDPSTLASIAGQVVMVVEAQRTPRSEVEAALDMLDDCSTLQLLLNKVRLNITDSFGAYTDD